MSTPTTTGAPAPATTPTEKPEHVRWWKARFKSSKDRETWVHWWSRWDAPIYALEVLFLVPFLGFHVPDFLGKVCVAALWFAIAPPLYYWLEGREISDQMDDAGKLNDKSVYAQIQSAQWLYWGAIGAVFIWALFLVGHIVAGWTDAPLWTDKGLLILYAPWRTPMYYGIVEWGIVVQTFFMVGKLSINIFYSIIFALLQATPRAQRLEERVRPQQ